MKKLLSVLFLLSLVVNFTSIAPIVKAIEIPEGATIKTANNPDVYIVKYKNGNQFKRLVLNPQVFESYGHLRWEDILTVSQSEMDSFVVSDLVRADGQTDIYQLVPNGDVGTKVLLESTVGYDLDLVYTINEVDFGNYTIGEVKEPQLISTTEELEVIPEVKEPIGSDLCANINCPDCQYCDAGTFISYCQGIDNNCGCTSCTSCNTDDGCMGNNYYDYFCSDNSCVNTSDDCSDCSCVCGGYNTEESIANRNCSDGKDNDCNGSIDSEDFKCFQGTKVSGIISENSTWTLENSPYIVTDNILIEGEISLIIKEGVEIKFNQDKFVQVMGYLEAVGTKEKPVIFTTNITNPSIGIWGPIKIGMAGEYEKGGNVNLEYCKIEYGKGIRIEAQNFSGQDFNNFTIRNCIFEKNTIGIDAHRPGPYSYVKNSIFTDNEVAIYIGWNIKYVQNPKNIDVVYNIFKNNNIGLQIASYGGIPSDPENHSMLYVKWNTFLQNKKYNLEMKYKNDVNYADNWWGTTNVLTINSKIYDYFDDFEKGRAIYTPFAISEIPNAGVQ